MGLGDAMNQTFVTVAVASVVAFMLNAVITPFVTFITQRLTDKKLDAFDRKREDELQRRDAEHVIVLAIARTMLLDNYEKCIAKGRYTLEEREVYGKLYNAYRKDGGNGVIETVAERIRKLPLE